MHRAVPSLHIRLHGVVLNCAQEQLCVRVCVCACACMRVCARAYIVVLAQNMEGEKRVVSREDERMD
jgi:hypothetical protein